MRPLTLLMMFGVAACGFSRPADVAFDASTDAPPPPPLQITSTSGDGQTGIAGSALAQPFVVSVHQAGALVAGVTIEFTVTAGAGELSQTSVVTDSAGQAATTLTLGTAAGANRMEANISGSAGSPVGFGAVGAAGPAAHFTLVSGNNQNAEFGAAAGMPLVVAIEDANANPIAGGMVNFIVTTGSGTVSPATATSDMQGHAQTTWTLGAPGPNAVEAQASGLTNSPLVFAATATGGFADNIEYSTGAGTSFVAIGDLNGDGQPDLVVASLSSNLVSVLLNATVTNAATPSFAARVDFSTGTSPCSIVIGDFNGDGKPDIAVANSGASTVSVLLNTTATNSTSPSFAARVDFSTGLDPVSIAMGDLNGDGKPDVAIAVSVNIDAA
jgi:hypothetical protein